VLYFTCCETQGAMRDSYMHRESLLSFSETCYLGGSLVALQLKKPK